VDDKIVIAKNHLLPEIYKNIGLDGVVEIEDDALKYIVENYTLEPGVRKFKEKLFEIVGEVNLNCLQDTLADIDFPIKITPEDIRTNYFKDKHEVQKYKIHKESKVGVINALWANKYAQGGVLQLQASFIPSNQFLGLKLTGSLGDVMKESISVSLTNAWNLTSPKRQKELIKMYNNPKLQEVYGLHIHCPDISTGKDGPSATTAFTVLLYSLFNNLKIKNYFGITGETSFDYQLTEIGGLEYKIIHSIASGVKEFIFPRENKRDFEKLMEKYKDKEIINGIKFHCIQTIEEVFDLIFDL
jgi:ATP-dependent Lon protease